MKFLSLKHPIITGMIKSVSLDGILKEIEKIREDGADAYGFQLEGCKSECKTEEAIKRILGAMSDKPVYFTNYMRRNSDPSVGWDKIEEEIITAVSAGADLIDIPGDMYSSADMELTGDPCAIKRQISLIERLHSLGCEVLMSSHVLRFISPECILDIAKEHERRGADVSKIVINTDTKDEMRDAFIASVELNRNLNIKSLLLSNGSEARTHRHIGPLFGSALFLATENSLVGQDQPTIKVAREIVRMNEVWGGGFFK